MAVLGELGRSNQQQRPNRQMVPAELLVEYQFPLSALEERLAARYRLQSEVHVQDVPQHVAKYIIKTLQSITEKTRGGAENVHNFGDCEGMAQQ